MTERAVIELPALELPAIDPAAIELLAIGSTRHRFCHDRCADDRVRGLTGGPR